uniref:Carrier domain-containing protein n=1 Tax=Leptobrachium leishanense TaxID=445787 RepID=A0A8C5PAM4_9ANUR
QLSGRADLGKGIYFFIHLLCIFYFFIGTGEGIDNFWKVIIEGKNCVVEIPRERFDVNKWYDPDSEKPGKMYTKRAGFIEGCSEFDNSLFGISNMEAEKMDPQQKLLLECTYRALEDAGYPLESVSGTETGVFIGIMHRDSDIIFNNSPNNITAFNGTGTLASATANRISYAFNLNGPSLAVDTACSSSLVALYYACQAIKQGDCEMAVCGGVNFIVEPRGFVALSKAKMISPCGMSKPFTKTADGYGRGEGCGVVLLKKLKKAKEDGSKVWGVICASALNHDGKSVSPMTKPSQSQQEALLRRIYSRINPDSLQYVEAHGTGTLIGDHVEASSIGNVIGKKRVAGSPPLRIGSVKANIGHTESASGMAGLIKVLLMMHHGMIPPLLHYSKEVGIAELEESNLTAPITPEKWEENRKFCRTAGINSFGIGGTNAHVLVKQHKQNDCRYVSRRPLEIFVISAMSRKSLQLTIEDTREHLNKMDSTSLENLVYTAACRRGHVNYKYRKTFLASSIKYLHNQLASANTETHLAQWSPHIVFVFCGNGLLYKGMCKMLLRSEPVFRRKCVEIDELLEAYTPLSMVQLLESEHGDFSRPDIAQLLLFTIQIALMTLLRHWGVKPSCIVGHSAGEVAAAHCSGLLSLPDAVKVIYFRCTLQSNITGGKMLVVGNLPVMEISNDLKAYGGRISMAAYNSPVSCTVSGDAESMRHLYGQLNHQYKKRNVFLHELDVPVAYHSHMMDSFVEELKDELQDLNTGKQEIDLISTVTGVKASKGDFTTGEYWARNIREPVAFDGAIRSAIKNKKNPVFIEIGPRRGLQRNIEEIVGKDSIVLPAVQPDEDYKAIFSVVAKLFTEGHNPDWSNIYETYKCTPGALPRYQFDHVKKHMDFEKTFQLNQSTAISSHPLIHNFTDDNTEVRSTISKAETSYIYEHKNNGIVVAPWSFFVELALAATLSSLKPKLPLSSITVGINFYTPCPVNQETLDLTLRLKEENKAKAFVVTSTCEHAEGNLQKTIEADGERRISFQHILRRCNLVLKQNEIYKALSDLGFQYGKEYKQVLDIHYGGEMKEGLARVSVSEEIEETMYEYYLHPVVLDMFFHVSVVVGAEGKESSTISLSEIGSLTVFKPLQKEMFIYLKTIKRTEDHVVFCGCFADGNGFTLVQIKNAKITFSTGASNKPTNIFYQNKWIRVPDVVNKPPMSPNILVFADTIGIGQHLSDITDDDVKCVTFSNWDMDTKFTENIKSQHKHVLFMWGIHRPSSDFPDSFSQYLAKCCEAYRQVILTVKKLNSGASIRTVTFRTTEMTVDHINPGFALIGMTRACVTEIPDITFQLIDISSSNPEDVNALAEVIHNYSPTHYPEVWIHKGQIYTSEVSRTEKNITEQSQRIVPLKMSDNFTLYTANPFATADISAEQTNSKATNLRDKYVEVQIDLISSHTEDLFPVSDSSWLYGNSLYWSELSTEKHKLLALDFTGTVTAVGKHVKKFKVGDQVASCYPTVASSRVSLPETVCFLIKKVPFFKNLPCISHFILAWEIFHRQLTQANNNKPKLVIISSETGTILNSVLTNIAKGRGWDPKVSPEIDVNAKQCSAMIILPSSKNISLEDIFQLPLLKELVLVQSQPLNEHYKEDVRVCVVDPVSIFQRAYIEECANDIHKWLQSMHAGTYQQTLRNSLATSTKRNGFDKKISRLNSTVHSLPLIQLDKKTISNIPLVIKQETLFKHDEVYIVTGGLTGLGFETIKFILQNGGGHVVILSRRNPTPQMEEEIRKVKGEQRNVKITAISCDISNYLEVMKAMHTIQKLFPNIPIKGIFHSAVERHGGILENLNTPLFEKVLSAKVDGAVNLHRATLQQELDYFVCYSSISSFLGNAGQTNYAAAESFLYAFCQYRRNMGLSGQSINWGALDLGLPQNKNSLHEAKGILSLNKEEIHTHLQKCLKLNNCQQVISRFEFNTMNDSLLCFIPTLKKRFYNVIREEGVSLEDPSQVQLNPKYNDMTSEDYVKLLISELTGFNSSDIPMDAYLNSLGIDSIMGMNLHGRILLEKKVHLPMAKLFDASTTVSTIISIVNGNAVGQEEMRNSLVIEETQF